MEYNGFKDILASVDDEKEDNKESVIESNNDILSEDEIENLQQRVFDDELNDNILKKANDKKSSKDNNLYSGHRQRARERFLKNPDDISDYDLLELLLFLIIPRTDTKKIAKALINDHKTLKNIFNLDVKKINEYHINGENFKYITTLIKTVNSRVLKQKLNDGLVIDNMQSLFEYCQTKLGSLDEEQFRILFFDNKMRLLDDVSFGLSGVSDVIVSLRDIVKKSLDLKAKNVVLYHNHPGKDVTPSKEDIEITDKIVDLLKSINISVIDHIIISNGSYFSFNRENLL